MGMKHHRIYCIKIGLRGAKVCETCILEVVNGAMRAAKTTSPCCCLSPICPVCSNRNRETKGRMGKTTWGIRQNGMGDKERWGGG